MARRPRSRGGARPAQRENAGPSAGQRASQSAEPSERMAFYGARDNACSACACAIPRGELHTVEGEQPVCLSCADVDHLAFLPRGDTALTRRASKHSSERVLVVEWNRRRKRWERQGILVEAEAIDRAEAECAADADDRAQRRVVAAARREVEEAAYLEAFEGAIRRLFPGCPTAEAHEIAEHACRKYSGRVGRSAAAKELDDDAVTLAVRAHIRHRHTRYDALLAAGEERQMARRLISRRLEEVVDTFRGRSG
jgi:hypothetical protein